MEIIKISDKSISKTSKPFIIAEIGVNYYDIAKKEKLDLIDAAKLMIKESAESGADAVKFQTYKAEKLASVYSPAYWDTSKENTKSQYELFKKFDKFGEDEFIELARHCKKTKTIFLSTPFDFESADYLDKIMPLYKISSSDITNIPFIQHIAKKKKPIFLSTGASTIKEIKEAVKTITNEKNSQIVLMHCILSYPTNYNDANLAMIQHLKKTFPKCLIGYSDHTVPDKHMLVLLSSYLLGAKVIEKHFTLDKKLPGNDHYHAMDPSDLKELTKNIDFVYNLSGNKTKKPISAEKMARKFARRSIVATCNISKGDSITEDMITFKRPGTGISPIFFNKVLGKKVKKDIKKDEIITWKKL